MTPFLGFSIRLAPYFIPQHNPIDPLFLKKINLFVSITFRSRDTRTKVGLLFHHNLLFNRFKAFCINFPLIFDPIECLFH